MTARFRLFLGVSALTALLSLALGCTKGTSDAQVTSDIQAKMGTDSGLQNKQLTVQAASGTVTLSGTVDNDAQREAAARYAASEPGVHQVINNLQIAPAIAAPPSTAEPASAAESQPAPEPTRAKSSRPSPVSRKHHRQQSTATEEQVAQGSSPASAPPPAPAVAEQSPPAPPPVASAPPPPPEPQKVTVPSGSSLAVRLVDTIDSATAQTGDTFHATLDMPVAVDGDVVIPAHYDVDGHIVNAQSSGKFAGRALLELQLDRIKVGDKWYNIQTDHFKQETGARGKNTAEKVGGGAIAGAILGGIFGGGKGAAIGTVAGAGAGGGVQAAGKKPDIKLSSERILTFTLQAPVTIVPTTKSAREGRKLESP
ncbi:MAG: BON domain-containing protein [Acidobacteria bacterium]|nr:BON domain-containing protein [Acidobacteriota bacterium]